MQVARVVVAERLTPEKLFFDYAVPAELEVTEGAVVFVPWRNQRSWGFVSKLTDQGEVSKLKSILSVVPVSPISQKDRAAIFALASHYKVSPGFILRSFFPTPPRRGLSLPTSKKIFQEKLGFNTLPKIYWLRDDQPTSVFIKQYLKKLRRATALFFPLVREQMAAEKFLKIGHQKISFWQMREHLLAGSGPRVLSLTRRLAFLVPPYYAVALAHVERREFVQFDMNPRYSLEEVLRARCFVPDLLVEAPRFIDWYQAEQKQVSLLQAGSANPPEIANLEPQDFSFLSDILKQKISDALQNNKNIVLFHWQTGEARELSCCHCFWQAECGECLRPQILATVSALRCPACFKEGPIPTACPKCGAVDLKPRRLGLAGWRKQVAKTFPDIQDERLQIRTIPELPFDIQNLGLVAVLSADALWRHPQFDTAWRAWQGLTAVQRFAQINRSHFLIQTKTKGHAVIQALMLGKPEALYAQEKNEREQFHLPPFGTYLRFKPGPRSKTKILPPGRYYLDGKNYLIFLPTTDEKIISEAVTQLPSDWHLDRFPFI